MKSELDEASEVNEKAKDLQSRTVSETAALHKINLDPNYGVSLEVVGKYLVTSIDANGPVCYAINYVSDKEVYVYFENFWCTTTKPVVRKVAENSVAKRVTSSFRLSEIRPARSQTAACDARQALMELRV